MILRNKLKDITESLQYFPVVGIIGPRQVGKTTIAKEISKTIKKETLYIDLENPRDIAKLQDPVLYFEAHTDKCIILDEIQNAPQLFSVLRSMIDLKREPGRFIILGSASPELIRGSSESLAGRIAYIELAPFNLTEVYKANQNIVDELWVRGGFPDAFLVNKPEITEQWHYNYIRT